MKETEDERIYYSISEVSKMLGLAASALRFWETEFSALKPYKNKRGERFYTKKDIEYLRKILYLTKEKGFTLQGAKEELKNKQNVDNRPEIKLRLLEIRRKLQLLHDAINMQEPEPYKDTLF